MNAPRPSLNALRAFEAAARLGSLTAAANELGVSHGAVSHHIASIEALFGIPLLRRLPHSVQPTEEGGRLAGRLTEGFRLINAGVKLLQPAPLKISCSSTIMMHWLIPRLASFKELYPNAEVRLNVNYGLVDFVREEISVAIRLDSIEAPKDVLVEPQIREEIGPVCAPGYLAQHPIATCVDLKRVRLLASATRPRAWQDWWAANDAPTSALLPHETYEHFYLQNQAAACGLGVALSPRILVADQIAAGRLVAPLGFVAGPYNLVLWIASHLRLRPDLRALVGWLSTKMQETSRAEQKGARPKLKYKR
jgi:LysR family glycine cleavage system transcriptional activator